MHIMNIEQAKFSSAFGIDMAKILADKESSVSAAWGIVPVGGETTPHKHDEIEAFVILSGAGEIILDGQKHAVSAGTVIVFEPFEKHVLKNTGVETLRFTDFYWRNTAQRVVASKARAESLLEGRPIFVFSTPPTPNGDLHLGHLSGPYLGADVLVRFLRSTGHDAYHLTGSDDYQSYVVGRARQENSTPKEVASYYAAEIKKTLEMMDIKIDQYTVTSDDPTYETGLQAFFSRLVDGGVKQEVGPALFDNLNDAYLYEVDVSGICPTCNFPASGNICEECGEPNTCVEFTEPRSKFSDDAPRRGEIERYSLCLSDFKDVILKHHRHAKISPRLQQLAANVLTRQDFKVPITHPASWGISPKEKAAGQQVIWVWHEMAYGFLHGISEIGKRLGRNWQADQPKSDWKIIHFFGYDNSFYHSILYPVLYHLAFPEWQCDIDYNHNEFYLLDGLKFSTSRRHAIWGKDILTHESVDAVRYYLAWTRGEEARSNFSIFDFNHCVNKILVGQWQYWLTDLGQRLEKSFNNIAPDAGSWTPSHVGYINSLENRLLTIRNFYSTDGFSLNHVVTEINHLVSDVIGFASSYQQIQENVALEGDDRTAIVLELATALLLAQVTTPLLPRFAASLSEALGIIDSGYWPDSVELVPAGNTINLASCTFFVSINKEVDMPVQPEVVL